MEWTHAREWAGKRAADWGLQVSEHQRLLLVGPSERLGEVRELTAAIDQELEAVLGLPSVRADDPDLVFWLEDAGQYYDLHAAVSPPGEHNMSAGFAMRGSAPFVALNAVTPRAALETLAHEWVHHRLAELTLPLWVEEGLAQVFSEAWAGRGIADPEALARAREALTIEALLSGEAFDNPVMREGAYRFSAAWVRAQLGDPAAFVRFLRAVRPEDGGRAAAREVLGLELDQLPLGADRPAPERSSRLPSLLLALLPVVALVFVALQVRDCRQRQVLDAWTQEGVALGAEGYEACKTATELEAQTCWRDDLVCSTKVRTLANACYSALDRCAAACEADWPCQARQPWCRELHSIRQTRCACP